jgi:apolipoprotein N-acyltransferase
MRLSLSTKNALNFILVVFLSAAAYFFANGFHNIWLLMWLAPVPLCIYALRSSFVATLVAGFFAYFIGGLADTFVYWHTKLGMSGSAKAAVEHAVIYALLLTLFRYVAIKFKHWVAIFVFAFGWMSYEFIVSFFSIHGTIVSIAYTQLRNLPIIQIAAITGVWGISFLMLFIPASIAFIWHYRDDKKLALKTGFITLAILLPVIGFGNFRIHMPRTKPKIKVGVAAVTLNQKEVIAVFTNEDKTVVDSIIDRYVSCIKSLAQRGAKVVLLPEEVVYMREDNLNRTLEKFSSAAAETKIYLIVGLNTKEHDKFYSSAYVFSPDGAVALRYDKQHLLPFAEEASYTPGNKLGILQTKDFEPNDLVKLGVAICKDMDFIHPALSYSQQGVGIVFVPSWDFGYDAWIHGRMSLMRGVEGNFAVARAAQDGLLTITDSRGKFIVRAETRYASESTTIIGDVPLGSGCSFYSYFGNWFAWLGIIFFAIMLLGNLWIIVRARKGLGITNPWILK